MTYLPTAFLSYTRLDNQYFGGAITSLKNWLELGVQVVTGDRTFNIFQDINDIEFGENWKKGLSEAIATSKFFIPVVTPLFFKSDACRDELQQFMAHEKSLGRNDLILPIYFVTAPVLERPELLKEDQLAATISSRQRYDWRINADLPLNDPKIRRSITELAGKIAEAIDRAPAPLSYPAMAVRSDDAKDDKGSRLVESLGRERERQQDRKLVLWVDDRPDNNIIERHSMAPYNIDFVLAQSTEEALVELRERRFDAIISDMGRPPDLRAGYTLLKAVRGSGDQIPYFIYAGSRDPQYVLEARTRGAQGTTNVGDELLQMLLQALDA